MWSATHGLWTLSLPFDPLQCFWGFDPPQNPCARLKYAKTIQKYSKFSQFAAFGGPCSNSLPNSSINNWEELETLFTQIWSGKRDHGYSLTEFNAIKKKANENMNEFFKRFNKLYNSLPIEMKPPPNGARVGFTGAFELFFSFTLRERIS